MKSQYPRTIRNGSATAKIYKVVTHSGTVYSVDYILDGKRTRRAFTDPADAHGHAKTVVANMAQGRVHDAKITGRDADQLTEAKRMLAGTNTPLTVVVGEWLDAKKKLGDIPVAVAVGYYLQHRPDKLTRTTVKDAAALYFAEEMKPGEVSAVHIRRVKGVVSRFASDFSKFMDEVGSDAVKEWVDHLKGINYQQSKKNRVPKPLGPRTRKNHLNILSAFFNWAKVKKIVPKAFDELTCIERPRVVTPDPQPWRPSEMVKLLAAADDDFKPYVFIRGFAGVRADEAMRMTWDMVGQDHIRLPASVTKTKGGRVIPLAGNLKAWIADYGQRRGRICTYRNPSNKLTQTVRRAGLKPRHNALRDSFASYRLAITKSAAQTSLEAGNSPRMLRESYLELKTEDEGKAWFSIMPEHVNKVVVLNQKEAA